MKTMKSILVLFVLAVTANIGFAQKQIILHQSTGEDYISTTLKVDSITFQDFAAPGTAYCNTYTDSNALVMNSHSKVTWDAQYKGNIGMICGSFDENASDIIFDEANPANIAFEGKVRLSTTQTFEPGREVPGGCVDANMGVLYATHYDTIQADSLYSGSTGNYQVIAADTVLVWDAPVDSTDWAYLTVAAGDMTTFGDGYKTTNAQFTYKGLTTAETLYMKFLGVIQGYYTFEAEFQFLASSVSTDPRYCSGNIKSMVHVKMHMKYK